MGQSDWGYKRVVLTSMSKPIFLFPSWCAEYSLEMSTFPFTPEFSARARGTDSKASANFLMAYCSKPGQDYKQVRKEEISASEICLGCTSSSQTLHYLSIRSDLLGKLDLRSSSSRYQSFVLKMVKYVESLAGLTKDLSGHIFLTLTCIFNWWRSKTSWLTLTRTLKVLTPSSIALSMSSIRLSVEPLITTVEMAPSSFSVLNHTRQQITLKRDRDRV